MFFMGGMTLGYLHPPVRGKRADPAASAAEDDNKMTKRSPAGREDGAFERTLLWARRILC